MKQYAVITWLMNNTAICRKYESETEAYRIAAYIVANGLQDKDVFYPTHRISKVVIHPVEEKE